MKKLILLICCFILLPLAASAKSNYYKGTLYYLDNSKLENVEILFPLMPYNKQIKVKINGEKQRLDANLFKALVIEIEENGARYTFLRREGLRYYKDKKPKSFGQLWSLVNESDASLMFSITAEAYNLVTVKKELTMLTIGRVGTFNNFLSRYDSDKMINIIYMTSSNFHESVLALRDVLFLGCDMEAITEYTKKDLRKGDGLEKTLMEMYQDCLKTKYQEP